MLRMYGPSIELVAHRHCDVFVPTAITSTLYKVGVIRSLRDSV